jgi:hypothetical protein
MLGYGPGIVVERSLYLVSNGVQLVTSVHLCAQRSILTVVRLGVGDHAFDLGLVQRRGLADGDLLLGAGVLVARRDMQDAIGIDVEGDLYLRHTAWCWPDVLQTESAQHPVVTRPFPFTLQHDNINCRLVVFGGAEDLGTPGRDGGVALDYLGHHTTEGFQPQRQWRHIEQQYVLDLALDDRGLDGGTNGHHLVWVDRHIGFAAAGHAAYQGLYGGDPCRAPHEDDLINVVSCHLGVCHGLLHRPQTPLNKIGSELVER